MAARRRGFGIALAGWIVAAAVLVSLFLAVRVPGTLTDKAPGYSAAPVRSPGANPGTLAVLVGDADRDMDLDYSALKARLSGSFGKIAVLAAGDPIPDAARVLLVLGSGALASPDAAAVSGFLERGGSVFFALKGVNVEAGEGLSAASMPSGALAPVLETYGLALGEGLVLDADALVVPYESPATGEVRFLPYMHWWGCVPAAPGEGISVPSRLDLIWPSPVSVRSVRGIETRILARASPKARLMREPFVLDPPLVGEWFSSSGGAASPGAVVAVAASRAGKAAGGRIVVVGSADFAGDIASTAGAKDNFAFVSACLAWLGSGDS